MPCGRTAAAEAYGSGGADHVEGPSDIDSQKRGRPTRSIPGIDCELIMSGSDTARQPELTRFFPLHEANALGLHHGPVPSRRRRSQAAARLPVQSNPCSDWSPSCR